MLYDKRWDKPVETHDPFTLENFIAWLETQPPDKAYEYSHGKTCAIGQFCQSISTTYSDQLHSDKGRFFPIFREWNWYITKPFPWTFGAALKRARELAVKEN